MSCSCEVPSRVFACGIRAVPLRKSAAVGRSRGDHEDGLEWLPGLEGRRSRIARRPGRGRSDDRREVAGLGGEQLKGMGEVVALGADAVRLAASKRGLLLQKCANR